MFKTVFLDWNVLLPVLDLDVGSARTHGQDGGNRSLDDGRKALRIHSRYTAHRRYATHTAHTTHTAHITLTAGTACAAGTAFTARAAHAARADHRTVRIIYLTSTAAHAAHAASAASITSARVRVLTPQRILEIFARLPLPPPLLSVTPPLRLRYNDPQPPPPLPCKARGVGHGSRSATAGPPALPITTLHV